MILNNKERRADGKRRFDGMLSQLEKDIVAAVSSYFKPTVFDRVDFIEDILLPCFR